MTAVKLSMSTIAVVIIKQTPIAYHSRNEWMCVVMFSLMIRISIEKHAKASKTIHAAKNRPRLHTIISIPHCKAISKQGFAFTVDPESEHYLPIGLSQRRLEQIFETF